MQHEQILTNLGEALLLMCRSEAEKRHVFRAQTPEQAESGRQPEPKFVPQDRDAGCV
jgi:hypothetical protein